MAAKYQSRKKLNRIAYRYVNFLNEWVTLGWNLQPKIRIDFLFLEWKRQGGHYGYSMK